MMHSICLLSRRLTFLLLFSVPDSLTNCSSHFFIIQSTFRIDTKFSKAERYTRLNLLISCCLRPTDNGKLIISAINPYLSSLTELVCT
ncbi:unnamed protein product [Schistosoma curassoni]|uniref:Secreted protein n=1 Tax=Schistosoma curassoni TaxID=6186 RepID=A0A183JM45_9TREM|nr:unnamed protein product [Schistosoma curassoni]